MSRGFFNISFCQILGNLDKGCKLAALIRHAENLKKYTSK